MNKKETLLSEAIAQGFDPRNLFSYYTAEQFISFANWISGRNSFDWKAYQQWLDNNYSLWHDPMPPIYSKGDAVEFTPVLGEPSTPVPAVINAVHLYRNASKYDIELQLAEDMKERLYNVPATFLTRKNS